MDRLNIPSDNVNHGEVPAAAILDALQDVISDVHMFVADWCQRLDHVVASYDPPPTVLGQPADEDLHQRIQDFQQEKHQWESERDVAALQIQEKADQLTEAWLRLEDEQRKFLQIKESRLQTARDRTPAEPVRSHGEDHANSDGPSPQRSMPAASNPSRADVVQQFQRLRREIESSRPKSGQL